MIKEPSKEVREFVTLLEKFPCGALRHQLPLATREHDKVRQSARRMGLAVYEDRGMGFRWFSTKGKKP